MADDPELNPFSAPQTIQAPALRAGGDTGPAGIGGWLILVVIALCVTPIRLVFLLVTTHLPIFTSGQFSVLTDPDSAAYDPLWQPLLIMEVVGNLGMAVTAVVALVLMFRKSRAFPKLMIGYYLFNLIFILTDYFVANMIPAVRLAADPALVGEVTKSLVGSLIWLPYMCVSKRVKNTFVF
jgi:hypothetical protein